MKLIKIVFIDGKQTKKTNIVCSFSWEALSFKSSDVSTYSRVTSETRKVKATNTAIKLWGNKREGT